MTSKRGHVSRRKPRLYRQGSSDQAGGGCGNSGATAPDRRIPAARIYQRSLGLLSSR
jgi:hypothetical protein